VLGKCYLNFILFVDNSTLSDEPDGSLAVVEKRLKSQYESLSDVKNYIVHVIQRGEELGRVSNLASMELFESMYVFHLHFRIFNFSRLSIVQKST
jgi:hypothetical protein